MKVLNVVRTLVGFAILGVWTAILLPIAFASFLISPRGDASLWMARRLWSPVLNTVAAGSSVSVRGQEHVDPTRPAIYLVNHQGIMDVPLICVSLPLNFRFAMKHTLGYIPFFGWYLHAARFIFLDRSNRAQAVRSLAKAAEIIRSGTSLVMFPEGTRTRDGKILPFKKGPFMLALKAKVPVVPIAIEGPYETYGKHSLIANFGVPYRVNIGAPIDTSGLGEHDRDALMKRVRDALIDLNLEIGGRGGDKANFVARAGVEGMGDGETVQPAESEGAT